MGSVLSLHTSLNAALCLGSIAAITHSLCTPSQAGTYKIHLWIGIAVYLFYPIITELLINLKAALFKSSISKENHRCCGYGEKELR